MFYEKDFPRLRHHTSQLQIFTLKFHNHAERKDNPEKFSDQFTLHGYCYIFYQHLSKLERCLWTLVVATSILSTLFICSMLSDKYSGQAIITVVEDSQYPVHNIEFPAVAVCTKHRINWGRIDMARRKFLPPDASNDTVEMFMKFVKRLDVLSYKSFDNMAGLDEEPVHLINSISISEVAMYLAFRCDDLIENDCMWSHKPLDCCSHFIPEKTGFGMCLLFNSIISPRSKQKMESDKFYPYRTSRNGEGSGLIFTIKGNVSNILPGPENMRGVELMIKRSDQWTDELTYKLRPNTYNDVVISPATTVTKENVKALPRTVRNCTIKNDLSQWLKIPGHKYRKWNCRTQCRLGYLVRACNCTIPLFFSTLVDKYRECTALDYICIYKNRDLFANINLPNIEKHIKLTERTMTCPCPTSCDSVDYSITLNTRPIQPKFYLNDIIRVNIYYQSEVMMKYVRKLKFTAWDLIAYFGGVIALLIGASLLTVAQLIQFLITVVVSYLRQRMQSQTMIRHVRPVVT